MKEARRWQCAMPDGGGLTGGQQTECYSSPASIVSRPGARGPHGEPFWVVDEDQEAPERWLDNGNNVGGEQWRLELMREEEMGGRAQWRGAE
jgi:hypothetical protein